MEELILAVVEFADFRKFTVEETIFINENSPYAEFTEQLELKYEVPLVMLICKAQLLGEYKIVKIV